MGYRQGDGTGDDAAARGCGLGAQDQGVSGGVWHGELSEWWKSRFGFPLDSLLLLIEAEEV